MAAPVVQATGTFQSGTGALTVPWPAHAVDDIGVLIVGNANVAITLDTAAGFAQEANSPQATGTVRIARYWCRATSTSMASPVVTANADFGMAQIVTLRGCITTGNPWDSGFGSVWGAQVQIQFDLGGVTTTVDECLVLCACVSNLDGDSTAVYSAWTSAVLTGFAEVIDQGIALGTGGALGVGAGVKTVAGSLAGATEATQSASSAFCEISAAYKPIPTISFGFDAASEVERTGTTTPQTWTHTPVGVPRGVAVAIVHGTSSTDHITAVSYGGVALARHIRAIDSVTELGAAELWFRGTGLPAGAQTVSATCGATTDDIHFVSMTFTGNADTEVIDTDSLSADVANPSVTLQYAGRTCMAVAALYGGGAAPTSFTPNANCTTVHDFDLGAFYSEVIRQTTKGSADFAIGGTATSDDVAYVAMAITEVRPASAKVVGQSIHRASRW